MRLGSTRNCSVCDAKHDRRGSYCARHHAQYMREWRAADAERMTELLDAADALLIHGITCERRQRLTMAVEAVRKARRQKS